MYSLVFLAVASFTLSLFLTPLVRNQALRHRWVDVPDACRKFHSLPTPRLGGVAILLSAIGSYLLLLFMSFSAGHIVRSGMPFALRLLPAVIVIFAVGLIDDVVGVRAWNKLVAQIAAAMLAWFNGIHLGAFGGHPLPSALSFMLTIIWIVVCTNALNLIDGVDGLATGIGLFATITTLIAAVLHHNIDLAFATVPLAGALLGFLRFNFNPASIFLGDCGSLTLGFLLGCYGIVWSEKSTTLFGVTAPLVALSVPLLDVGLAVVRRFLCCQPIFGADRSHIHHKLLSRGMRPKYVVLILYGFCGVAAGASLLLTTVREQDRGFLIVLVCLAAWLGLQQLGYSEFGIAGKMAFQGAFRGLLNAQVLLLRFEEELSTSTTIEHCSEVLCLASPQFGFSAVEICLDGIVARKDPPEGWRVRIDIPGHGYIHLMRENGATSHGVAGVLFIDSVSRIFISKLGEVNMSHAELGRYAPVD